VKNTGNDEQKRRFEGEKGRVEGGEKGRLEGEKKLLYYIFSKEEVPDVKREGNNKRNRPAAKWKRLERSGGGRRT